MWHQQERQLESLKSKQELNTSAFKYYLAVSNTNENLYLKNDTFIYKIRRRYCVIRSTDTLKPLYLKGKENYKRQFGLLSLEQERTSTSKATNDSRSETFLFKGSNFHLTNYLEVQTRSELASVDSKVAAEQQNIVGNKKKPAHASLSVHYIMQHTTELWINLCEFAKEQVSKWSTWRYMT